MPTIFPCVVETTKGTVGVTTVVGAGVSGGLKSLQRLTLQASCRLNVFAPSQSAQLLQVVPSSAQK